MLNNIAATLGGGVLISAGDYESISTVTVGAGGSSTVTISSIPSTYTHLQLRISAKTSRTTDVIDGMGFRLNGDTGSNYSQHWLQGNGSAAAAFGYASQSRGWLGFSGASTASDLAGLVVDILDYSNTSKYTTTRTLWGLDANGSGRVGLASSVWMNTAAVSSIEILPDYNAYAQYSHFALYGIK